MSLFIPVSSCFHPDENLMLAVNNLGPKALAPVAVVFCDFCRGAWTADTLPKDLLDRCLELFEGMRS